MSTVNKILVPVDGSVASKKSAEKAIDIAKKYNSEIMFLTVVAVPHMNRHAEYYYSVVDHENMMKYNVEAETKMLEDIISNLELDGINYGKKVVKGEPYEEILREANKTQYDYIIMGRRGFSKIERFFVGSVTQRVISEAPCPVIVVKE